MTQVDLPATLLPHDIAISKLVGYYLGNADCAAGGALQARYSAFLCFIFRLTNLPSQDLASKYDAHVFKQELTEVLGDQLSQPILTQLDHDLLELTGERDTFASSQAGPHDPLHHARNDIERWISNDVSLSDDNYVRANSYLGVYLRRNALALRQMSFRQTLRLQENLRRWWAGETLKRPRHITDDPAEHSRELFLDAWKQADYSTALEHLSRHFDYVERQQPHDSGPPTTSSQLSYQYALLNLALLQSDFRCDREALWAVHEAIDAARDNKDVVCLNIALAWLSELVMHDEEAVSEGSYLREEDTNLYVIKRARDNNLPAIESRAWLSRRAGSAREALENLTRSTRVAIDSNTSYSLAQFAAMHDFWRDADQPSLAAAALLLASVFADTTEVNEDVAVVKCRAAQNAWQAGDRDTARTAITDALSQSEGIVICEDIYRSQLAVFDAESREGGMTVDQLAFVVAGNTARADNIQLRHLETAVLQLIQEGQYTRAQQILDLKLKPIVGRGLAQQPQQRHAISELLNAKLAHATGEHETALLHAAKAMRIAAAYRLRYQLSEVRAFVTTLAHDVRQKTELGRSLAVR
ncbi:APC5 protein [Savitreella phatthalungensis]